MSGPGAEARPPEQRSKGSGGRFFPMPRRDGIYLLILIIYTVITFLPLWRGGGVAGMIWLGWLLAALMVLSPGIAILLLFLETRSRRRDPERPGPGEDAGR